MATTIYLSALLAFALALVQVRALCTRWLARLVVDMPNARSLHTLPTPRTGGIGLMLAVMIAWLTLKPATAAAGLEPNGTSAVVLTAAIAGLLALIFLIDDVRGLPVSVRLGAQFAAAIAFVAMTLGTATPLSLLLWPLLVVGIVWSINLFNFMDGTNGLAGGMAMFGFSAFAIAARAAGTGDIALLSAIVAGAAAGFLVWNFDPARIFLGDAGSIPLGFLAAALGVLGWQRGAFPFWMPLLVFSPFWVDATLTLWHRWKRGEKLSEAHRSHYYQRLIQMGWSHRKLALAQYALMAALAWSALALRTAEPIAVVAVLAVWIAVYAGLAFAIDGLWVRFAVKR